MNKSQLWEPFLLNDTIDIVAPASASNEDKLHQGLTWLKKNGLNSRVPKNLIDKDVFFASTLENQWEQFKAALDSDSKAIWCLRGGYGSMRLIPLLEKITPPKKPKLLIGFSDITALHLYFNQKWNWPSLHGRTISQLHPDWDMNQEHQNLIDLLFGRIRKVTYRNLIPMNQAARENKSIEAKIIGGNLRLIQSSLGTSWQVDPKDKILFIEDVSERGYSIDRMLEQLHQAGIIHQGLKALLIGDFTDGKEKNGDDLMTIALERFALRVDYPVIRGLPCGHAKDINSALPFNTSSTLELGSSPLLSVNAPHLL